MIAKKGDAGDFVKQIQEWLCYYRFSVVIDGEFGNATEVAVKKFQSSKMLVASGIVGPDTWTYLNFPITYISTYGSLKDNSLLDMIVCAANRHYEVRPIEIGGENRGPFVRYYMRGKEGKDWPWCAGSMSTIVLQAFEMAGMSPDNKFKYSMSCDQIYEDAKKFGTLTDEPKAGCIFLSHKMYIPDDCIHTGIVTSYNKMSNVIETTEGNTNDSGSREGFEFVPRIRSLKDKHFIDLSK